MVEEKKVYIATARRLYSEIARVGELEARVSDGQDAVVDTGGEQQLENEVQNVPPGELMSVVGLHNITASSEEHAAELCKLFGYFNRN